MKRKIGCIFIACMLSFACACNGTGDQTDSEAFSTDTSSITSEEVQEEVFAITNAYAGKSLDVLNENLRKYLSLTDAGETATFLRARMNQNYSVGQMVKIAWAGGKSPYTIVFSADADFEETVIKQISFVGNYNVEAGLFLPGRTYYYKVTDVRGNETAADSFQVLQGPRIVTVGGAKNIRDVGGWKTENGDTIAYGKVFRGAHIDDIADGGKTTLISLGIKTDLDLRTGTEAKNATESPVSNFSYHRVSILPYDRIFETNSKSLIKKTMEYFSDESHYPIFYHCRAGADRTGTLTFLLNGLCGVSFEDLTRDFEMTSFFGVGHRWRSAIKVESGNAYFTDDGVMQDNESNYVAWNKLYMEMMDRYGTESGKLSDAIAAYLLDIGMTEEQIEKIRAILLDKSTDLGA